MKNLITSYCCIKRNFQRDYIIGFRIAWHNWWLYAMKNVAEMNEIVSSLTFALSGWCGVGCAKDFSAAIFMLISVCSFGRLYRFHGFFFDLFGFFFISFVRWFVRSFRLVRIILFDGNSIGNVIWREGCSAFESKLNLFGSFISKLNSSLDSIFAIYTLWKKLARNRIINLVFFVISSYCWSDCLCRCFCLAFKKRDKKKKKRGRSFRMSVFSSVLLYKKFYQSE